MTQHPAPARPKKPGQVTVRDVQRHPDYYLAHDGPGRDAARQSLCPHRRALTDSCPNCP